MFGLIFKKFSLLQSLFHFAHSFLFKSQDQKKIKFAFCPVCGNRNIILIHSNNLRETGICLWCSANTRNKFIIEIVKRILLLKAFNINFENKSLEELLKKLNLFQFSLKKIIKLIKLNDFKIFEPSSSGTIYKILKNYSNFTFSEYLTQLDLKPGQFYKNIRFEDLQDLTFKNNTFDLIITQDVFEHIKDPSKAFMEIHRVLKPNGIHIFTVPLGARQKSICRIDKFDNILKHPVKSHQDPIRTNGSIVYNEFGLDLVDKLKEFNFSTFVLKSKPKEEYGILSEVNVFISIKNID